MFLKFIFFISVIATLFYFSISKDRVMFTYTAQEPGIRVHVATPTPVKENTPISISTTPVPTQPKKDVVMNKPKVTVTPVPKENDIPKVETVAKPKLITNEFAYWNPRYRGVALSDVWNMTSGSLFLDQDRYWTGKIDYSIPNIDSSNGTNSAIFRLVTKDTSFENFTLSFNLDPVSMTETTETPAVEWDGVHVFLRYQSQYNLYYASIYRRDGLVVIKKKCKGGPSNGGEYYHLSDAIRIATPKNIKVSVIDLPDSSVQIQIMDGEKVLLTGLDKGIGCPVISSPGAVGIRGDNTEFYFSDFNVVKS